MIRSFSAFVLIGVFITGCSSNSTWYDPTSWWNGEEEDTSAALDPPENLEDHYPELRSVPEPPPQGEREEIIEELRAADPEERRYQDQRGETSAASKPAAPAAPAARSAASVAAQDDIVRESLPPAGKKAKEARRLVSPREEPRPRQGKVRPPRPFEAPPRFRSSARETSRRPSAPPPERVAPAPPPPRVESPSPPRGDVAIGRPRVDGRTFVPMESVDSRTPIVVLRFANGSFTLSAAEGERLKRHIDAIRQHRGAVRIVGHASSKTADMDPLRRRLVNFDMSLKRARHVAEILSGMGIDFRSMIIEGRSDTRPIYRETMPAGEAANRRVEIFLLPAVAG